MISERQIITPQAFEQFTERPENADKLFELIDGEIVEKVTSNPYSSAVSGQILRLMGNFVYPNDLGHVTGEGGGYIVSAPNYFAPDVAFISKARQPKLPRQGYNPILPDLAVEVISPSDLYSEVAKKVATYLKNGTRLVWVVDCDNQTVTAHTINGAKTYYADDMLDGGDVLPGFLVKVIDIFPE